MNQVIPMKTILPFDEIQKQFDKPIRLEQMGMDQFETIVARHPHRILNTAVTVWRRHLERNPSTNPQAVQDHIRVHGGSFLEAAGAVLGQPIIQDIAFSRCTIDDPALTDHLVAYLLVARVFPNDLHVSDLHLMNPYKPIPPKLRRYRFRKYKGLGLLGTVVARIEAYAAANKCEYITLTADADDLVPLFGKFGFMVEDNEVTSLAMQKKVIP
jgi:hypothetical protein